MKKYYLKIFILVICSIFSFLIIPNSHALSWNWTFSNPYFVLPRNYDNVSDTGIHVIPGSAWDWKYVRTRIAKPWNNSVTVVIQSGFASFYMKDWNFTGVPQNDSSSAYSIYDCRSEFRTGHYCTISSVSYGDYIYMLFKFEKIEQITRIKIFK